jgi:hypothetical protein
MSKIWTKQDLTWGFELELSNVPKNFVIPEHLGKWEWCEVDIINTRGKYANICADPKGVNPPVGGEINTKPTNTKEEQVDRIMEIIDMFKKAGHDPDVGMTAHSHIHVHVKGLIDDIDSLKCLILNSFDNQKTIFDKAYRFDDKKITKRVVGVNNYLKNDGARMIPEWLVINILEKTNNFGDVINMFCKGKDGISQTRPIRYGINFYSLKHINTIEFRCFRGTTKKEELIDCFDFVENLIIGGLNNELKINELFHQKDWKFPPMIFDEEQAEGWVRTKHHVELIKGKNRKFWEVK